MNYQLFHTITFDVLYGCIGLLVFIMLERGIYLSYLGWRMQRLAAIIGRAERGAAQDVRAVAWRDPVSRAVVRYAQTIVTGATRERQEDISSALFIGIDKKVSGRLWILDTIVTAAPLLGLLGTIFGIMETFDALAAGGVSDSAAVSRGIGTALIATAIGIATALLGLLGNNALSRRAHVIMEDFKALLLSLSGSSESGSSESQSAAAPGAAAPIHAALPTPVLRRGTADR